MPYLNKRMYEYISGAEVHANNYEFQLTREEDLKDELRSGF